MGVIMKKIAIKFLVLSAVAVIALSMPVFADSALTEGDPTYASSGIVEDGIGLTDNNHYVFSDGEIDLNPDEVLLMLKGTFTSKATALLFSDRFTEDRFCVPLRIVAETFGASVEWDDADKEVTIHNGDDVITIQINSDDATLNGSAVTLRAKPIIVKDRVYVYQYFVTEFLNLDAAAMPDYEFPSFAANPIVAVDYVNTANGEYSPSDEYDAYAEGLDYVKTELMLGLDNMVANCAGGEYETEILAAEPKIRDDINNMTGIGQVGRYYMYDGPYITLVDMNTNDIYFYKHGNAFGGVYKADMKDPDLFLQDYIAG